MKWFEIITEQNEYTVQPKTTAELKQIIEKTISEQANGCDLNFIDTSKITDMSYLFSGSKFDGNISKWDVSNVKYMNGMFSASKFNGDISKWNVSRVINMYEMFIESKFNSDISKWNVSNVTNMCDMFSDSKFNGDISKWNVSKVTNMNRMFYNSKFNGDISNWSISQKCDTEKMFLYSPLEDKYGEDAEILKNKKLPDNLFNLLKQVEKDSYKWPSKWCDFDYLLSYLKNEKNVNLTKDNIKEIKKIANSIFTTYKINGEVYYSFGASKREVENELEEM